MDLSFRSLNRIVKHAATLIRPHSHIDKTNGI